MARSLLEPVLMHWLSQAHLSVTRAAPHTAATTRHRGAVPRPQDREGDSCTGPTCPYGTSRVGYLGRAGAGTVAALREFVRGPDPGWRGEGRGGIRPAWGGSFDRLVDAPRRQSSAVRLCLRRYGRPKGSSVPYVWLSRGWPRAISVRRRRVPSGTTDIWPQCFERGWSDEAGSRCVLVAG
ncbi:hypothetical protein GCM10018952_64820 [Streptosporangium vulgare]